MHPRRLLLERRPPTFQYLEMVFGNTSSIFRDRSSFVAVLASHRQFARTIAIVFSRVDNYYFHISCTRSLSLRFAAAAPGLVLLKSSLLVRFLAHSKK